MCIEEEKAFTINCIDILKTGYAGLFNGDIVDIRKYPEEKINLIQNVQKWIKDFELELKEINKQISEGNLYFKRKKQNG